MFTFVFRYQLITVSAQYSTMLAYIYTSYSSAMYL
jgi:hypothetical protein